MTLKDAVDYARTKKTVHVGNPATPDEIRAAEARLGISFHEDYIELLRCYGALYVEGGWVVHGLSPGPGPFLDRTLEQLATSDWAPASGVNTWPPGVLRICEDGGFGYFTMLSSAYSDPRIYCADVEQCLMNSEDRVLDDFVLNLWADSLAAWIKEMADLEDR